MSKYRIAFGIASFGDSRSYNGYIITGYRNFTRSFGCYRETTGSTHIGEITSVKMTLPNGNSGGSVNISYPGTHKINIIENTLSGLSIPESFTDSITITGWQSNGYCIIEFD